jgi:hypothetical protein
MDDPTSVAGAFESLLDTLEERLAADQSLCDASALDDVSERAIQRLLSIATKAYVRKLEAGHRFGPFTSGANGVAVTATDAVATASAMLDALQIEVFELGMWQTRGGFSSTTQESELGRNGDD